MDKKQGQVKTEIIDELSFQVKKHTIVAEWSTLFLGAIEEMIKHHAEKQYIDKPK